ncbi:hypothetical protein F5984_23680 [Rudanella paleaurantiibacter]|uniref:DUF5723 domain-containing protein n=1 Tax=Rudanella paleaurantiibacter TaxID=2614655 RepID=A0A7J5TTG1_9BACT|nr:hypothetical protein [Rudanella paleaurantiibacter]KAB7726631.1 hypothetical protein F5984_23680 [Rudanella paleaurantiibacter]
MKLLYAWLSVLLIGTSTRAQTPTDELLDASKVRQKIILWPDFTQKDPLFKFELDESKGTETAKPLSGSVTFAVSLKDKSVNVVTPFYNPLRFSLTVSDTSLIDPSYQSVSDHVNGITAILKETGLTIPSQSISDFENHGFKDLATGRFSMIIGEAGGSVQGAAAAETLDLQLGELAEWGYLAASVSLDCINLQSPTIKWLIGLDKEFSKTTFNHDLTDVLERLKEAESLNEFKRIRTDLTKTLKDLKKLNETNHRKLSNFVEAVATQDFITMGSSNTVCEAFGDYSKLVFKRVVETLQTKQKKREQLITIAVNLDESLEQILNKTGLVNTANGTQSTNSFILGTYRVSFDKMSDLTLVMRKREVDFSADQPEINELNEKITAKIRLRAYRRLIPEFSIGTYYSSLTYNLYNAKVSSKVLSSSLVETATTVDSVVGRDKNPMVLAGMLNLTLNTYSGEAHPVFQFGVGTGKGRPSILLGGGVRFRRANPLVISLGVIWAWKKELNELKLGQTISGQSQIDNDLKYQGFWEPFRNRPQFYAGLQYAFKSK